MLRVKYLVLKVMVAWVDDRKPNYFLIEFCNAKTTETFMF
jgi:hypothetical protein